MFVTTIIKLTQRKGRLNKMKPSQTKWIIILGLALIAVTTFALVPIMNVSYEETTLKEVSETIYVTEEYTELEEYQTLEDSAQNLFGDAEFTLIYGRKAYSAYIDVSEKSSCRINCYVTLFEQTDCSFYVVSEGYYSSHSDYEIYPPEEFSVAVPLIDKNQAETFSFTPSESDTYYFVFTPLPPFDAWTTEGRNEFSVIFDYQQEVILTKEVVKYRDVPKTITEEKEVTETKTKKVSILDYLLNYS